MQNLNGNGQDPTQQWIVNDDNSLSPASNPTQFIGNYGQNLYLVNSGDPALLVWTPGQGPSGQRSLTT